MSLTPIRARLLALLLVLAMLLPLTGCRKWMTELQGLFGDKEGDVTKSAKRPKVNARLEAMRKDALARVQGAKARPGWTILKEVKNYKKIAAKIAKKKKLPRPTGFDWAAICASGGTCKVIMGFWDGRTRYQAVWLAGKKDIEPLNCWAMSFMARSKEALACFKKEALAKKKNKAKAAPTPARAGKTKDRDAVWETLPNAAKAAAAGQPQAAPTKRK